jgi:hypothetical protein
LLGEMYRGGGAAMATVMSALLTVAVLCSGVAGVGALGDSMATAAHTKGSSSAEVQGAAAHPTHAAARRALLAMGINDVEAAVSRLFEAKRDALEYANK